MASTFTDNIGIEKIADGEQSAIWGQTTNNNFELIDRAVNGVGFVSVSSTTLTVTTSDGVLTDGQFAALVFTGGAGAAATVTISPNTAQKTYLVRNTTSQNLVLTQGSGSTVTIAAGGTAAIACTGSGPTSSVFDMTALMNTATNVNTPSTIVRRDAAGAFSGNLTGNVTGNASSATKLASARTIGGVVFDGTANVVLPGLVPSGAIILWSGAVATIPTGWLLCNGANGTPDLRERFVVGAGGTYAPGDTGGADSVTLTQEQIPAHLHGVDLTSGGQSADHTHPGTTSTNGGHSHAVKGQDNDGKPTGAASDEVANIETPGSGEDYFTRFTASAGVHAHTFTTGVPSSDHTHNVNGNTGNTGGGAAHENRPPYYALAYIMKA